MNEFQCTYVCCGASLICTKTGDGNVTPVEFFLPLNPVRASDLAQSALDGPRMFPSM